MGSACYLLNLALLWLVVERVGLHYIPATILCIGLMLVVGHFLNRRHTFRSVEKFAPELLRFALVRLVQIGTGLGAIVVLVEFAAVPYLLANIVVTAILTVVSFVAQQRFVFGETSTTKRSN